MPQSHAEHRKPKLLEQVRRVVRTQRKSIHTIPAAVLYFGGGDVLRTEKHREDEATLLLLEYLTGHSVDAKLQDGWIVPAGGAGPPAQAKFFNERQSGKTTLLQLDVRIQLSDDRILVESFGGWGPTRDGAVSRAFENFAQNSLHVLLGAFYSEPDDQITVETWEIGKNLWTSLIGNFGTQSSAGQPPIPDGLFDVIEGCIRELELTESIHWFRIYYCNVDHVTPPTCEALLDNEPWSGAQKAVASIGWSQPASFFSVRNFLILKPAGRTR